MMLCGPCRTQACLHELDAVLVFVSVPWLVPARYVARPMRGGNMHAGFATGMLCPSGTRGSADVCRALHLAGVRVNIMA